MTTADNSFLRSYRKLYIALEEVLETLTVASVESFVEELNSKLALGLKEYDWPSSTSATKVKSGKVELPHRSVTLTPPVVDRILRLSTQWQLNEEKVVALFDTYVEQMVTLTERTGEANPAKSASTTDHYEAYTDPGYDEDLLRFYYAERLGKLKTLQTMLRISQDDAHSYYKLAQSFEKHLGDDFDSWRRGVLYEFAEKRTAQFPPGAPTAWFPLWAHQLWLEQRALLELFFLTLVAQPTCTPLQVHDYLSELTRAPEIPVALNAHLPDAAERAVRDEVLILANLAAVYALQLPAPPADAGDDENTDYATRTLLQCPEVFLDVEAVLRARPTLPLLAVGWGLTWARMVQRLELVGHTDRYQPLVEALQAADSTGDDGITAPLATAAAKSAAATGSGLGVAEGGDKRLQWMAAGFRLGLLSTLEAALASELLGETNPSAPGYRHIVKELLLQLCTHLEVNHLPEFDQLVNCAAALFTDQPELGVQFWTDDMLVPGRTSLLEYAQGRFPYAFRPFVRLVTALFTPASADHVTAYMQRLPTLTAVVLHDDANAVEFLPGTLDMARRRTLWPLPIFPDDTGFVLPAGTEGLQLSGSGRTTLVRWAHAYTAWDFFHHLLDYLLRGPDDEVVISLFGAPAYAVIEDTLRLYQRVFTHFFGTTSEDGVVGPAAAESANAQDVLIHQLTGLLAAATAGLDEPGANAERSAALRAVARLCLGCLTQLAANYPRSVLEALDDHGVVPAAASTTDLAALVAVPTPPASRLYRPLAVAGPTATQGWLDTLVAHESRLGEFSTALAFVRLVRLLLQRTWAMDTVGDDAAELTMSGVNLAAITHRPARVLTAALGAVHNVLYLRLATLEIRSPIEWATLTGAVLDLYDAVLRPQTASGLPHPYPAVYQRFVSDLLTKPTPVAWEPVRATLARVVPDLYRLRQAAEVARVETVETLLLTTLGLLKTLVLTLYCADSANGTPGLLRLWRDWDRAGDRRGLLPALYPCILYADRPAVCTAALETINLVFPLMARYDLVLPIPEIYVHSSALVRHANQAAKRWRDQPTLAAAVVHYAAVVLRAAPTHAFALLTGRLDAREPTALADSCLATTLIGWVKFQAAMRQNAPTLLTAALRVLYLAVSPGTGVPAVYSSLRGDAAFWTAAAELALANPSLPPVAEAALQPTRSPAKAPSGHANRDPALAEWVSGLHQITAQAAVGPLLLVALHYPGDEKVSGALKRLTTESTILEQSRVVFAGMAAAGDRSSTAKANAQISATDNLADLFEELAAVETQLRDRVGLDLTRFVSPVRSHLEAAAVATTLGPDYVYDVALVADHLARRLPDDPSLVQRVVPLLRRINLYRSRTAAEREREATWGDLLVSPALWARLAPGGDAAAGCLPCRLADLGVDRLRRLGAVHDTPTLVRACQLARVVMTVAALCRLQVSVRSVRCPPPLAALRSLAPLLADHLGSTPEPFGSPYFSSGLLVFRSYLGAVYACLLSRPAGDQDTRRALSQEVARLQGPVCGWLRGVCTVYAEQLAATDSGDTSATGRGILPAVPNASDVFDVPDFDLVVASATLLFHELFRPAHNAFALNSLVVLQQYDMGPFFAHQLARPLDAIVLQNLLLALGALAHVDGALEQLVASDLLPALSRCPAWGSLADVDLSAPLTAAATHLPSAVTLTLTLLTSVVRTLGRHATVQTQVMAALAPLAPYLDGVVRSLQVAESRTRPWTLAELAVVEGLVQLAGAAAAHGVAWTDPLLPRVVPVVLLRYTHWLCRPSSLAVTDPRSSLIVGLDGASSDNGAPVATTRTKEARLAALLQGPSQAGDARFLGTLVITGLDPAAEALAGYLPTARPTDPPHLPIGPHVLRTLRDTLLTLTRFTPSLADLSQLHPGSGDAEGLAAAAHAAWGHRVPWLELSMSAAGNHLTLGSLLDLAADCVAAFESPTSSSAGAGPSSSAGVTMKPPPLGPALGLTTAASAKSNANGKGTSTLAPRVLVVSILQNLLLYAAAQLALQTHVPAAIPSNSTRDAFHRSARQFRENTLPSVSRDIRDTVRRIRSAVEAAFPSVTKITGTTAANEMGPDIQAAHELWGLCDVYPKLLVKLVPKSQ
ncbi:hypothetical protein IWQ60_000539 [Tieghemiomyces parasiticus]|uniref:Nucleoporin n=1 Tax=Tieghemiomyces parasiticus TaxID=78921 RepID=A0A9W8AFS1_9FUNG|nr:hypothetical protein IWQ60_000539 [Tieghemiomyces parasiticus]